MRIIELMADAARRVPIAVILRKAPSALIERENMA